MASSKVSLARDAAQIGALLDSPEIAGLITELEATRWTGRPGFPIRIWDTAVLAAASVQVPFLESAPRSERADDGGRAPQHYRRVCQRRRQIPDRGTQRGVDECPAAPNR